MDRFQYLLVMAACVVVTLPLEVVFGARVYRQAHRVLRTLAVPFIVFFAWDAVAISRGDWFFAPRYTTGCTVPFSVPVEEVVFFCVVPICALLTYEVVVRLTDGPRRGGHAATRQEQRA